MDDELKKLVVDIPAKVELVVMRGLQLHVQQYHKSIGIGTLITLAVLVAAGLATYIANS